MRSNSKVKKDFRPASTMLLKDRYDMTIAELIVSSMNMAPEYYELKPETLDRGTVVIRPVYMEHVFILSRSVAAVLIQGLLQLCGEYLSAFWIFPLYLATFIIFLLATVKQFEALALKGGTLREKIVGRDKTPDESIPALAQAYTIYGLARILGVFLLKFNPMETPAFFWTYPARLFTWIIVLDYFFYSYHRLCHEVPKLWLIHRKHHTTKAPSPALSALASNYQELLEIVIIPLLATLIVPMSFHELYFAACYTTYIEISGHSGIRTIVQTPIAGPILRIFGMELLGEDHDAHHHSGKGGKNYGKQTRMFDVLFGTTEERKEHCNLKGMTAY